MMEIIAESKFVRISPRKVRLVAAAISDLPIKDALAQLVFIKKRAALPILKVLKSAVANAVNNAKVSEDRLHIKSIVVNEGSRLKRFRAAARGHTRPYLKRSSHIRVVLETKEEKWDKK